MNANELRIGNYLNPGIGYITTVSTIKQIEVGFHQRAGHGEILIGIDKIEPIHLTPEWLVKFGFEKDFNSGWCMPNKYFELMYNKVIGYRLSIEGQYAYNEIKYVHQLQNLYFALTGEELEIKI